MTQRLSQNLSQNLSDSARVGPDLPWPGAIRYDRGGGDMPDPLTLMTVHAHPDDEAIGTGGVLARYSDEGLHTVLVTCTGGEVGEIADSALASPENLAQVRLQELRAACEILGVGELH